MSTDEVYGSLGEDGLFTETTAYDPRSPYSASKASSDHFIRAYGETYGLLMLYPIVLITMESIIFRKVNSPFY